MLKNLLNDTPDTFPNSRPVVLAAERPDLDELFGRRLEPLAQRLDLVLGQS